MPAASARKKTKPATPKAKKLSKVLPEWDLTDFYPALNAPEVDKDLAALARANARFCKAYQANVSKLSGAELAKAIVEFEKIYELMGKLGSYAQLLYAKNMSDPAIAQFYQNIQEKLTVENSRIIFFTLDINKLSEKALKELLKNAALKKYAPWLRDVRSYRKYQLSDDLEKILLEKNVSGASAWTRLFDETIAGLKFPVDNKQLSSAEIFNLLSSSDGAVRKKAAISIGKVFATQAPLFTLITNTLAKDKETEDKWRGFSQPISSRNVSNFIEDEVVEALLDAVKSSYPKLSHRYYKQKAKWFGQKKLDYWDRNAPLPQDADKLYSWDEAKELVLSAYSRFSPELAKHGKVFFDKPWIDAAVTPGKSPGAFAHPCVPSVHPYLLVNFQGKARDVMTLAHELGHGVHQVLCASQGTLMSDTPLTLAETASVFGEQLTFREMIRREKNEEIRTRLIASKVEDMLNTVVRQVAFCEFEKQVHGQRRSGELSTDQIGKIWMDVQSESLGPAIKLGGDYKHYWMYIPHFIHSPFYVYAYAFGDCLVNSLYGVYEKEAKKNKAAAFEKKYLNMLSAGGTLWHKELLEPFGLDASNPAFWQEGLDVIASYIDELS